MIKILIVEPNYSKEAKRILSKVGKVVEHPLTQDALRNAIYNYHVVILRLSVRIDKKIIDAASKLKIIATSTTGLDHIDINYATQRNIHVVSLKGETDFLHTIWATPEHTFALLLSLLRKVPSNTNSVKKGKWEKQEFVGRELNGKTLGILGCGRVGTIVAGIAKGFGMKVVGFDPNVSPAKRSRVGIEPVSFNQLFKQCDIVTLHADLHKGSMKLIGKKEFKDMKPTDVIINTARGQMIDEKALLSALQEKRILGAAIDVMDKEEPTGKFLHKNPLIDYAKKNHNLIITSHIAGTTHESLEKTQVFIAKKICERVHASKLIS